jgi:hypothetical protein
MSGKLLLTDGDMYNLDKYINLDEGVAILFTEILNDPVTLRRCNDLKWAREALMSRLVVAHM